MIISGFIRCTCGKMHTMSGIDHNTKCSCDTPLFPILDIEAGQRIAAIIVKKGLPFSW